MNLETLFLKLVNRSITASWLILVILILRLFLKKAPKNIRCVLWALVAIRLIIPFSFKSAFSLIPSSQPIPENIVIMNQPAIESGISLINEAVNPILAESFSAVAQPDSYPLQDVVSALSQIWAIGAVALLIYASASSFHLKRKVRAALTEQADILISDEAKSPFILGILKPKIYIPSFLQEKRRDFVIAHERAHKARRDHWWKLLGFLLLAIYWFNPLSWLAFSLLCRDIELACDERVIRNFSAQDRAAYSQTLLDFSSSRSVLTISPLAFGETGVSERVKSVLNYRKPSFWIISAALAAGVFVAICFMTDPFSDKKLSDKLAVSMDIAIAQHHGDLKYADDLMVADYEVLRISESRHTITVYAWVLKEEYRYENNSLRTESGSHIPTVITFDADVSKDASSYPVIEYWIPRDGDDYASDLKAKFPLLLWKKAFDNSCISVQQQRCQKQAEEYFSEKMNSAMPVGYYICEKEGFCGKFTLSINPDGSFSYYEGMLSSYIGFGRWESDGHLVTLIDNTFEEERRTVFVMEGLNLVFDKEHSTPFIYVDLPDGTKFMRYEGQPSGAAVKISDDGVQSVFY